MTLWQTTITAVGALIGGAVGSLGAPWANWGAAKRRLRRDDRKALVQGWRALIQETTASRQVTRDFLEDGRYQTLSRHLQPAAREEIERRADRTYFVPAETPGVGYFRDTHLLAREVDRIEKKWRLP
jgi:hypothetical protein